MTTTEKLLIKFDKLFKDCTDRGVCVTPTYFPDDNMRFMCAMVFNDGREDMFDYSAYGKSIDECVKKFDEQFYNILKNEQ